MIAPARRTSLSLLIAGALFLSPLSVATVSADEADDATITSSPAAVVATQDAPDQHADAVATDVTDAATETATTTAAETDADGEVAEVVTVAAPTLTGELAVGSSLEARTTDWPTLAGGPTYQWSADGAPIAGATGPTLTLTTQQAGRVVNVTVTGTLEDGSVVTETSANTLRVATAGTPGVSGTARVGNTLTSSTGTWTTGTTYTYQWLGDGRPITGATGATFVPTNAQSGMRIAVAVTGARAGYPTLTRVSAATSARVMRWATPKISGTVAVGSTLTAKPGTWTTGTTFTYRWYANGTAITGATNPTFRLTTAQKDKRITVKVTGKKWSHPTTIKTSAATGKVMLAPTPKITGTAVHGNTLKASPGTWTPYVTRRYQWYADGVAIAGATSSSLKLGTAQKDKRITVKVTGTRSGYAKVTKTSAKTLRVQTAPTPKITGTRKVTYTLTASRGTWSSGTTFTYQWYANGVAITGATSSKLKLSTKHVGKTIKVKVTGRKSGYPTVSRTSGSTVAITYPLSTPGSSTGSCPSWAPIKGNADSMIYHMPYGAYYSVTKAEECFRTEAAAVDAGYRKSKR